MTAEGRMPRRDGRQTMTITKEWKGNKLTVIPEGRLDSDTAGELEKALKEELPRADYLTLDFKKLVYISSAGLRVLRTAGKVMDEKKGLRIIHVNDDVMDVFHITGFTGFFDIS